MSRLCRLLKEAFPPKESQSFFEIAPWRIVFVQRTWDTQFTLFYLNRRIASGNTYDKVFTITSEDSDVIKKIVDDVSACLPEYKFNFIP